MAGTQRVRGLRELSPDEIGNVESNYGFNVQGNSPLSGGQRSNTAYLDTNEGRRVVKIYPNNFSPQLIDFQARACAHLHRDGIPVPKLFPNSQGRYITPLDDTNYIVMDYLEGEPLRHGEEGVIDLAFRPLALVLNSLSRFDHSEIKVAPELEIPLSQQLAELTDNLLKRGRSGVDPVVWSYQDRLNDVYSSLSRILESPGLSEQLILGDYNLGSILVHDGRFKGILDFDLMHLQGKGFDFMHVFDLLFVDKSTEGISLEQRVNFDKLGKAMAVYSEEDKDISSQLFSFPMMLQLLGVRNLVDVWGNYYAGRSDREYFEEKKSVYIPRLEIGVQLGDRIIETLDEAVSK